MGLNFKRLYNRYESMEGNEREFMINSQSVSLFVNNKLNFNNCYFILIIVY